MSISRRRDRVRIYAHSDEGTEGEISPVYTLVAERWGSRTDLSGREQRPAQQAEHTVTAVFELPDDVPVPLDGLLRVDADCYFVRAVRPRRIQRALIVDAERIDDERFIASLIADGLVLADGSEIGDGVRSSLVEA